MEICEGGKYPQELLPGHLMAHEPDHVLPGENSHSPHGIMSARLSPGDLRLASHGVLFFDSKQASRMRGRLSGQEPARGR